MSDCPDPTPAPGPQGHRPAELPLPLRLGLLALALGALLHPALWNGFPVVFFDTGGYLMRALELELEPGRSLFYGLFLQAASLRWLSLWGPVLVHGLLVLWLLRLTLRTLHLPFGAATLAGTAALLAGLTALPWFTAQLMPDVLVPVAVLCLWLLGFRWNRLGAWERAGVAGIGLLALLSHMSTMALGLGLAVGMVLLSPLARGSDPLDRPRPGPPALLVAASLLLMPLLHLGLVGQATYTPGGPVFVFGRLVQDGIVQRLLDDRCPQDPDAYALCPWQADLPTTANDFIWHRDSPFRRIGWWGGADAELARMVRDAVAAYPGEVALTALRATAAQLGKVATGDGLDEWQDFTHWTFRRHLPEHLPGFAAARQQRQEPIGELFAGLNLVHRPVAWLSLAGTAGVLAWALATRRRHLAGFAALVLLALLGNAFISGALSNPHDRYQSRMVWLGVLAVLAGVLEWWHTRDGIRSAPASP